MIINKKTKRAYAFTACAVFLSMSMLFAGCSQTGVTTFKNNGKDFKVDIVTTQEDTENLILDIQKPQVSGIQQSDIINSQISQDIDSYIEEVRSAAKELEDPSVPPMDTKISLYIRTTSYVAADNSYASILMECSNYTGGAHGMNWNTAYTISLKDGTIYSAGDLFKDPQAGLEQLRQIVLNHIAEDPEAYFPSAEEYVKGLDTFSFYIYEGNLVLWFNPYDLAPYAAGLITIDIPLADLNGILLK